MYHNTAKGLAALGRNGDSMLMHVNPQEVAALSKILGPTTTNPKTGLPEASNWSMVLGTLGGLATGVGGLGLGASIAGPAEDWAMNQFGEGLISDFLGKAAPVAAGAGLGAAIGGATGGKYGAMGGALQGGLSGGLGGMEAGNIVGTPGYNTPTVADAGSPDFVGPRPDQIGPTPMATTGQQMPHTQFTKAPSDFTVNLQKYGSKLGNWDSLKKLAGDYGGSLFTTGMLGQTIAGMGSNENAYEQMKRRQQLSDWRQQSAAEDAYQRLYGGQGIGVNYASGGDVHYSLQGPTPISITIPESAVDQIHAAGGIGNLVQQHMAVGGYVNTQPFQPQDSYPQSRIASAQPYPAASPTTMLDVAHYGARFAEGGDIEGGFLDGEGDGMSDDIDADIEGEEPVKVADGEFVIPRHLVEQVGGPERLDELLKEIRRRAYGTEDQIKQDAAKQAAMDFMDEA